MSVIFSVYFVNNWFESSETEAYSYDTTSWHAAIFRLFYEGNNMGFSCTKKPPKKTNISAKGIQSNIGLSNGVTPQNSVFREGWCADIVKWKHWLVLQ